LRERVLSLFSCRTDDDEDEAPPRALVIGGPADFHQKETSDGGPLRAPIVGAPAPYVRER
ncbi:unnamed protein product, partial [Aureobasidium uvarum]